MTATHENTIPIAILDFGSQFTHLISRRLRNAGIYCEIFSPEVETSFLIEKKVQGVILSGGPASVYEVGAPSFNAAVLNLGIPVLGICYGFQLMAKILGGKVVPLETKEFGRAVADIKKSSILFEGIDDINQVVWMSHGDSVVELPDGFEQIASTSNCMFAASENIKRKMFGLQFHPEVAHTKSGQTMLVNFAKNICGCEPNWNISTYIHEIEDHIKEKVGNRNVFLLFSGGIDSTVLFVLLNRVLGTSRVRGAFIDTGFLRPGDTKNAFDIMTSNGYSNYLSYDATEEFYSKLKGISDPEMKRNIIGQLFLDIKERIMASESLNPESWILAQGTIYPDIITSGGSKNARVIKTHHNSLPSLQNLEVLEPLRYLYKDEVRKLAKELSFPHDFIWKHPFPGPGVAVRIAGDPTDKVKLSLYHQLDEIVLRNLRLSGWYEKLWMGFPILINISEAIDTGYVFDDTRNKKIFKIVHDGLGSVSTLFDNIHSTVLPIKSVGVKGDYRSYEHPVELRIIKGNERANIPLEIIEEISKDITNGIGDVNRVLLTIKFNGEPTRWNTIIVLRMLLSVDTLTSDWAKLEYELLDTIANEIMTISNAVDAVLLDVTQKPPGTMEWE